MKNKNGNDLNVCRRDKKEEYKKESSSWWEDAGKLDEIGKTE